MIKDFVEGMHKVGEAMAAAVSAQVTKDAQLKLAAQESAGAPKATDKQPGLTPR